ncbi:UNVERIFIED_CONTAM: hypothetical protein PYX00_002124 [Menopon gallinae]|uniref:Fatty acyl-CoA reductase n=1 Tax=Menopon gallinae TaxID=328185 RepID=A0AAW2IGU2_9NEOP
MFQVHNLAESNHEKEYKKKYEGMKLEDMPDRVAGIFVGKNIFITGGTGFLGKVFIEKLLRMCPEVNMIYLLMRVKKGKDPKERIQEVFASPLFDKLRELHGNDITTKKLTAVSGDVTLPELGLSAEDRQMLIENVNFVYHMAATIRFDEPLKKAVLLNTRGTKLMLELSRQIKNLELFVYVSTAYCHLEEKVLEEKGYAPYCDPHELIKTVEWMDDDIVNSMTRKILGNCPNTYAFTKNLSEGLVNEVFREDPNFPGIIIRPSIVVPIWKEPLPGWTDNINGPTGLLIGAGKGVIRTMYCKQEGYADYIPVDVSASGLMVVSWNTVYNKDRDRKYYHFTSSEEIRVSWEELIALGRKITERIPLNGVVWYPGGSMKKSRLLHNICVFFFHTIPAYVIDTLIFLAGYKPIMCRVQQRITKGFEVFEYYANNQWQFMNTHVYHIRMIMNPRERAYYKIDGQGLDIEEYFEDCIKAARLYVLKEMPETLPAARRHLRIMYWVDVFTKIALLFLLFYVLSKYFDIVHFFFYGFLHLIAHVFSTITDTASSILFKR